MVKHLDARVVHAEAQLGADLEVAGHQPRAPGHARQLVLHRIGQHVPAGEVGRVPLPRSAVRAQRRDRYRDVVGEHRRQTDPGQRPGGAPQPARPAGQHRRHQRDQRQVSGQRPVEADPLGVGKKAKPEESEHHQPAQQAEQAHRLRIARPRRAPAAQQQCGQQQRGHEHRLQRDEAQAAGVQRPGMALDQLEAQARLGVLQVPGQQRHPRRGAERNRDPDPRIAQRLAPRRQHGQRNHAHADHGDEAVVAQRTDRQAQRQHHRRAVVDPAQQARARIDAQHGRQRHRHVRQRHDPQGPGQRQQHRRAAGQPRRPALAELALHDAHHHPRQRRAHQQERQPRTQVVVAGNLHAQPDQPRGQPRQIRVGPGQVLAFLPVEGFVDEQRQLAGHHQLEHRDSRPQGDEGAPRFRDPQPAVTHVDVIRHPYKDPVTLAWRRPAHTLARP